MQNYYSPEGTRYALAENKEYIGSITGLKYAKENGIILEGRAVMCDSSHNLYVELGSFRGIIPREEAVFSLTGEPVKDIAVITRVGKPVSFIITDIEEDGQGNVSIYLSRKLAQKDCFENFVSTLTLGDVIPAVVTHMEQFGAFCDIGCGIIALLPVDCVSVSRIGHPAERFVCGQRLYVVVKNIDEDLNRITLSHKELLGTWEENAAAFEAGQTVAGVIRSVENYGIFVELTPNLAGLAEWCDNVSVGQNAAVYIKSIIPEKMKIKLVIISSSCEKAGVVAPEYFIKEGHLSRWRYSPKECSKEIVTDFDLLS